MLNSVVHDTAWILGHFHTTGSAADSRSSARCTGSSRASPAASCRSGARSPLAAAPLV